MKIIFIKTIDANKNAVKINFFAPKGVIIYQIPCLYFTLFISFQSCRIYRNYMIIIFPSVTNL